MRLFILLPALACCLVTRPQELIELAASVEGTAILVRATSSDAGAPRPVLQAIWREGEEGVHFEMQRTAEPDGRAHLMLDRLMEPALGQYLDLHVRFEKHGVAADLTPDQLLAAMNAMVWAAEEEVGAAGTFAGFEAPTRDRLMRLTRIDWSQARFSVDGGDEQDKYLAIYFYVRSQREELERQMRADLLPLSAIDVLAPVQQELTAGQRERINSVCGTVFDQDNFLCALDLTVSDSGPAPPDPHLGARIADAPGAPVEPAREVKVRRRDRWLKAELDRINERIDRTDQRAELWALRDRMDDLQGQIDDLRLEVREPVNASDDNPIASLSALTGRNITIRFERYGVEPGPDHRLLLNEVFEQLARSPDDRVLITGYADRSGDPAVNLRLSEQRAKSVRNYLLQRGIAPERLMVNYYGDSRSEGRDPSERRVEIEWLR